MTADTASETSTEAPTEPIHIDGQSHLEEVIDDYDVVLTDFYADWCGPCKMIEPTVKTLAAETDAAVAKVDVDANQQLAAAFGVQGVPTLILFAGGEQAESIVGLQGEDQLRSLIQQYTE
ncbi:thioredoxin [Natronomonas sp.]|uniref:thioredoxin n=1 Tax=Natronomonas sp. TaxID=2184060 RepID=UPI002FC32097